MSNKIKTCHVRHYIAFFLLIFVTHFSNARDLAEIKADGVLRHIGIPYANFVSQYTQGDKTIESGLDVELMQGFAAHLGLRYEYVKANWANVFTLLNGESAHFINGQVVIGEHKQAIAGDIIANGATTLVFEGVPNYPDASRFWQVVDKHQVSIFYTAPTALRSLMGAGDSYLENTTRSSLRILGSVGEPINPEACNGILIKSAIKSAQSSTHGGRLKQVAS